MFNRIFYSSDTVHMGVTWFGLGRLYVIDRKRPFMRQATPEQKAFVFAVATAAENLGLKLHPNNKDCQEMLRQLTEDILYCEPDGWMWKAAYVGGPETYAQTYLPNSASI